MIRFRTPLVFALRTVAAVVALAALLAPVTARAALVDIKRAQEFDAYGDTGQVFMRGDLGFVGLAGSQELTTPGFYLFNNESGDGVMTRLANASGLHAMEFRELDAGLAIGDLLGRIFPASGWFNWAGTMTTVAHRASTEVVTGNAQFGNVGGNVLLSVDDGAGTVAMDGSTIFDAATNDFTFQNATAGISIDESDAYVYLTDGDFLPLDNNTMDLGSPSHIWDSAHIREITNPNDAQNLVLVPGANAAVEASGDFIVTGDLLRFTGISGGTTQGSVMYRNASGFVALTPSTSGLPLVTQGASANPTWAALADAAVSDTLTIGASGSVNDSAIPSGIARDTEINRRESFTCTTTTDVLNASAVFADIDGVTMTADRGVTMLRAGGITGISIYCDAVEPVGDATTVRVHVFKNGSPFWTAALENSFSTSGSPVVWKESATQANNLKTFSADDVLSVQIEEITGGDSITITDSIICVEVEYDN